MVAPEVALAEMERGAGLRGCEVRTFEALDGEKGGAIFSRCGTYRYLLWRFWGDPRWTHAPMVGWVMLNPSTANERELDPTLTRCRTRSLAMGPRGQEAGGMLVANLFALRSTDPKGLWSHHDPRGGESLAAIELLARLASPVICGWGCHGYLEGRDKIVKQVLAESGAELQCLGVTKAGNPRHPLYLPYSEGLRPLGA